jgi:2-keto-3-deoxy-L-rhamnonate aldolase RhmA
VCACPNALLHPVQCRPYSYRPHSAASGLRLAVDLSTELGVSGQFDAHEFRDAFAHLERVILEAGIPLGAAALTREQTRELLHRGHRLPVNGLDVLMLGNLVRQTADWRQQEG